MPVGLGGEIWERGFAVAKSGGRRLRGGYKGDRELVE